MATIGKNVELITVEVTLNGRKQNVQMPPEVYDMINDPKCDPAVKESVYQQIFEFQSEDNATQISIADQQSESDTCSTVTDTVTEKVHIWTEEEEKLLITSKEMDDEFYKLKNHEVLWARITRNMYYHGVKVTRSQVMNKWKNLKKKYREVLDENNKTGNKRITWKHLDSFNKIFGHKASSKASCTYDSSRKEKLSTNGSKISTLDSGDAVVAAEGSKDPKQSKESVHKERPKKRKSESMSSMFDRLEDIGKQMVEQMNTHQQEKMKRFDKFLEIFSKTKNADD